MVSRREETDLSAQLLRMQAEIDRMVLTLGEQWLAASRSRTAFGRFWSQFGGTS